MKSYLWRRLMTTSPWLLDCLQLIWAWTRPHSVINLKCTLWFGVHTLSLNCTIKRVSVIAYCDSFLIFFDMYRFDKKNHITRFRIYINIYMHDLIKWIITYVKVLCNLELCYVDDLLLKIKVSFTFKSNFFQVKLKIFRNSSFHIKK